MPRKPTAESLVNPTSMKQTIALCSVMTLMFVNFLLDSHPRHVAYREAQLAQQTQQRAPGFVDKADEDAPLTRSGYEQYRHPPSRVSAPTSTSRCERESSSPGGPSCGRYYHSPTPSEPKTKWPYRRHRDVYYDVDGDVWGGEYEYDRDKRLVSRSREEMSDAWMKMRSVRRIPYERVRRKDSGRRSKKTVRWGTIEVLTYLECN